MYNPMHVFDGYNFEIILILLCLCGYQFGDNAADWSLLSHADGCISSSLEWCSWRSRWNWQDWNDKGPRESSRCAVCCVQLFWRPRLHCYGQSMQFDWLVLLSDCMSYSHVTLHVFCDPWIQRFSSRTVGGRGPKARETSWPRFWKNDY